MDITFSIPSRLFLIICFYLFILFLPFYYYHLLKGYTYYRILFFLHNSLAILNFFFFFITRYKKAIEIFVNEAESHIRILTPILVMVAELLNCPNSVIHFGLVIALYDYDI